jgi:hypothetical protein
MSKPIQKEFEYTRENILRYFTMPSITTVPGTVAEKLLFVENSMTEAVVTVQHVFDSIKTGEIEDAVVAAKIAWGPGTSDMAVEKAIMLMASSPHEPQTQDAIYEAWWVSADNHPKGGTVQLAQFRASYGLPLIQDHVTGLYSLCSSAGTIAGYLIDYKTRPIKLPLPKLKP